ncbi:hypothetical protein J2801_003424 [Paraburkholderia phenoliruptrix]|nr:hypothetical protein [Paraburkholderia phenoliruptrix]
MTFRVGQLGERGELEGRAGGEPGKKTVEGTAARLAAHVPHGGSGENRQKA